MIDKIIWQYLLPTMARLPVLRKLAIRIYTKKLSGIVVQSINHYKEVIKTHGRTPLFNAGYESGY